MMAREKSRASIQDRRRGLGGFDLVALGLEQQAQSFEYVGLIVRNENAVGRGVIGCHWEK